MFKTFWLVKFASRFWKVVPMGGNFASGNCLGPALRLPGNNFASLQLKERVLVPTVSTMTYSGKRGMPLAPTAGQWKGQMVLVWGICRMRLMQLDLSKHLTSPNGCARPVFFFGVCVGYLFSKVQWCLHVIATLKIDNACLPVKLLFLLV